MNCPRCTQDVPEGGRFCPACGLDLHSVSGEFNALEALPEDSAENAPSELSSGEDSALDAASSARLWPQWLGIRDVASLKKPMLAATLAFFFGPFAYLYLEQPSWFWWGLLGGILLSILSWPWMFFLLHLGFILHSWDLAKILNERLAELGPEYLPSELLEEEGV